MKTTFLSLTLAVSLALGISAFAAPHHADTAPKPTLHKIEENCKLVQDYARIFEWENVDDAVDRIVAAEKKMLKAIEGKSDLKQQAGELHAAVKELRAARLNHNSERAIEAAEKVNKLAHDMEK